jgi:fibronectin-binding autotransporter adhesin
VSGTTFIVSGGVANDIAFTVNNSTLRFGDASSLGSATVAVSNNGALRLAETASGGTAAVTVSSGAFGIDTLTGAGTTVGSIAGDANGTISLGTKTLTVGGNNQSTFSPAGSWGPAGHW